LRGEETNLQFIAVKAAYNVGQAQAQLPKLLRQVEQGQTLAISRRDEPVAYLISKSRLEAIVETLEIMSNPAAVEALRQAKRGKLRYRPLSALDEA